MVPQQDATPRAGALIQRDRQSMSCSNHALSGGTVHPKYPRVFSPITLGPVEIPTQCFFAPHGSASSAATRPSDDVVAASVQRVRDGGGGLVRVALVAHERGRTRQSSLRLRENIAAFQGFADAIHAAGGKAFGQIFIFIGLVGWVRPVTAAQSACAVDRTVGAPVRLVGSHGVDARHDACGDSRYARGHAPVGA
jgi:hypothetical protein